MGQLGRFGLGYEIASKNRPKVHEFSIASEIWRSVSQAAAEHKARRVRSIAVEVGSLNLIEDEQLRFWVQALAEREGSPGVELKITHIPARIACRSCGEHSDIAPSASSHPHFIKPGMSCPACTSSDVRVSGGRELRVVTAEIETED